MRPGVRHRHRRNATVATTVTTGIRHRNATVATTVATTVAATVTVAVATVTPNLMQLPQRVDDLRDFV
ncbi:MAG: hypothetical protein OXU62_07510 [Gammaproteobacteria bacterium]|nr:hypothetical protein [Gammaproteobacteria bacterium]